MAGGDKESEPPFFLQKNGGQAASKDGVTFIQRFA